MNLVWIVEPWGYKAALSPIEIYAHLNALEKEVSWSVYFCVEGHRPSRSEERFPTSEEAIAYAEDYAEKWYEAITSWIADQDAKERDFYYHQNNPFTPLED